jgi:hypothetical protein
LLPQAVSDHYRAQQRLTLAALAMVRREWTRMGDDLDASWRTVGPRVATLTAAAQFGAATDGAAYVPLALKQQGHDLDGDAVNPAAFAGMATSLDGFTYWPLMGLLEGAVIHARRASVGSLRERLQVGGRMLDTLVHTQIADAGRMSASTKISATDGAGWTRLVNPPCCQRCAVLAGKFFESNQGFQRHPRCDCRHVPTVEANADTVGVKVDPDQIKDLTPAQRDALSEGADLGQVVNSHRAGTRSADLMSTNEGATRRGRKLTPEGIYRVSADRDEVLWRLADNGYLL